MKALVTGGSGFIGSHLVEGLLNRGYEVACLVRKDAKWLEKLPVELRRGDCGDPATLQGAIEGIDVVFHSAGLTKALRARDYHAVNDEGTKNLLQACIPHRKRIKKWIHVSSLACAGPSRDGLALKETDPCRPLTAYGRSKLAGERSVATHKDNFPVVIIRPPAVYGPRDGDFYPLFWLAQYGFTIAPRKGERTLSLCYVEDLVEGIILAAESSMPSGSIYYLSEETAYSWNDVAGEIGRAVGRKITPLRVPSILLFLAAAATEGLAFLTGRPPLLNRGKKIAHPRICSSLPCFVARFTSVRSLRASGSQLLRK